MNETLDELALGWAAFRSAKFAHAERHAAHVLAKRPNNVSALALHAISAWSQGKPVAEPLAEIRRAVELEPKNGAIRHNLAALLSSDGDFEGANEQYRVALSLKPDDAQAFYALAGSHRFRSEDELVRSMVALREQQTLPPLDQELLLFALAKVYDDLKDPERAFALATEANALAAQTRPFHPKQLRDDLADLRRMSAAETLRQLSTSNVASEDQVLIVGMSRSGTTLVESILSRHADALAQGELTQFRWLEGQARKGREKLGRYAILSFLNQQVLDRAAERLSSETRARAQGRPFKIAIDKQPDNALLLGLVARVFPRARVIYLRRHPLDVGLSNFFRRFTNGNAFAFTQEGIGLKTRVLAETMELWRQSLDLKILDVSYEALVIDLENQARRIIDFVGLPWDPACLVPERTSRTVLTASQWQVRQPVNANSVGRWRKYETWLGPMIDAMGGRGWIEAEFAAQASVASRSTSRS